MQSITRIGACALMLLMAGCSALQSREAVDQYAEGLEHNGSQTLDQFRRQAADASRALSQVVRQPWIAGKAQPLAREVTLPPALRANVNTTMLFDEREIGIVSLAERIQMATGIPTHVEPDTLLPREAFLPRLADETPTPLATMPNTMDTLVPALITSPMTVQTSGPRLPQGISRTSSGIFSAGTAPLATVLDAAALRLGVYWRYEPQTGAIRFYRTETRAFNIRAQALAEQTNMELGLSGEQNKGFDSMSNSKYRYESQLSPLDAVLAKVTQFLTRSGVVRAGDASSSTIVVTDTKDALDRLAEFLDAENRVMTRSVRLVFEEITIQRDHTAQAGFDWKLLFNSLGRQNTATGAGVGSTFGQDSALGTIGATVGSGPFAGSGVVISALSEFGTVVRRTSIPVLAKNRRTATYAVRETFSYVKDLQQTQSTSDGSAPTVTVTQDEKTVGTVLTVVPDAQEDGQVLLTLSYDDTRLIGGLQKEEFGSPDAPSFVQQHRIGGQGVVQQVELRPGQPVVIGGYEQSSGNSTRRRLDDRAPMLLGGSDNAQQKQLLTVLVVTALPEEGF